MTSLYNIKTFGLVDVDRKEENYVHLPGKSHFLETKYNQILKIWKSQMNVSYKVIEPKCVILDNLNKINDDTNEAFFEREDELNKMKLDSILISNSQKKHPLKIQSVISKDLHLPMAGLGTDKLEKSHLIEGFKRGFYLVDTAKAYANEETIGLSIKECGLNNIKVITKLSRENLENKDRLKEAVYDSIEKLGQVPELVLIHAPYQDIGMISLLKELESMKKEGYIKNWGVSNFDIEHLDLLLQEGLKPVLNQVEFHPYFQRSKLLEYCKQHNIILQAYRAIVQGKVLEDPVVKSIADKHKVGTADVIYSWFAQQKIPIIAKVSSIEHQKEYAESGQILLSKEEMDVLSKLNYSEGKGRTCTKGGWFIPFTEDIGKKWREARI